MSDPKPSSHAVNSQLREMILNFELYPGSRVTEQELASLFGVSRTPVRGALQRLEAEGYLTIQPKQGCYIRALDIAELTQYYQVRIALEMYSLELACTYMSDAKLKELAEAWDPLVTLVWVMAGVVVLGYAADAIKAVPLDKLDGFVRPLIAISQERVDAGKNPLFQSHMWDGSAVPIDENSAKLECVLDRQALVRWIARLRVAPLVAFDTETTSLDPLRAELVGLSFAVEPGEACYVPVAHRYAGVPVQLDRVEALDLLRPVLEDAAIAKVGSLPT